MEDSAKNRRDMNILLREAIRCGIQLLDLQQSLNFWDLCRKIEKFRMLQVFGVDNLDMLSDSRKDDIRHYLAEFSSISVREDSGEKNS